MEAYRLAAHKRRVMETIRVEGSCWCGHGSESGEGLEDAPLEDAMPLG